MLELSQRELYKEVLLETLKNLEFLGKTSSLQDLASKRVATHPLCHLKDNVM